MVTWENSAFWKCGTPTPTFRRPFAQEGWCRMAAGMANHRIRWHVQPLLRQHPEDGGNADILLSVDSVILAFRSFYIGGNLPESLIWRIHPI